MARVLLPCEVEEWWEDKRLFLLLSNIRSVSDLSTLITSHTREGTVPTVLSTRLKQLSGLLAFLNEYCTKEERSTYARVTIPFIARSASRLDELVPESGVPFIVQQEAASLVLGRKLVLSLIANGFLCTFPPSVCQHLETFSFNQLYSAFNEPGGKKGLNSRAAKLKCILCYFQKVAEKRADLSGMITLRRQVIQSEDLPALNDWVASQKPLCALRVDHNNTIEGSGSHTLQVDFANRKIGGGVLRGGCVQEEIKFVIFPELLVSKLIMDHMDDNEAIIITGAEQFSKYTGYRETFQFAGECQDTAERDVFGNFLTSTVAIDALPFGSEPERQFESEMVLRELNKAYAGYTCLQDRGDISTELIALSVQGPSMAYIAECYPDHHSTHTGTDSAPAPSVKSSQVDPNVHSGLTFKPGLLGSEYSVGAPPLSPIKELLESSAYTSVANSIIKNSVREATKNETDNEGADPVSQYAATLMSRLLLGATPETQRETITSEQATKGTDQSIDQFASNLASSLFSGSPSHSTTSKPDQDEADSAVNRFATSMVGSLFEAAPAKTEEKVTNTNTLPKPAQPGAEGGVDQFAAKMASSLLKTAKVAEDHSEGNKAEGCIGRFAANMVTSLFESERGGKDVNAPLESTNEEAVGGVEQFAAKMAGSLFSTVQSETKATSAKDTASTTDRSTGTDIDNLASSLTSAIIKSSAKPPDAPPTSMESAGDEAVAEKLAKSIITDVFSSVQPASSPEASAKTRGEPTNQSLASFSEQMANNILTSAFYTAQPLSGRPADHPAIFIQVERRGSLGVNESPRSSRSSSLTGQSITLHEFTDELAESLVRDGLSIAQLTSQSRDLQAMPPAPPREEDVKMVAEKVTESIMESVREGSHRAPPLVLSSTEERENAPPVSLPVEQEPLPLKKVLKNRLLFSKQELAMVAARMTKRGSMTDISEHSDTEGPPFQLNPRLLTPSSSRHSMGYAWSTASMRDEGSRPVSPTDFDRIALGLASDVDDYANIFSKILVSDSVLEVCGERPKKLRQGLFGEEYMFLSNVAALPSENKVDSFLSRLDQSEVSSQCSKDTLTQTVPNLQQKIKMVFLRPIATGNWGCGAFRGSPQFKCIIQLVAASLCDRPLMIYHTYGNQELKQLERVSEHLKSRRITAGRLCKALLDFAGQSPKKRAAKDLFSTLLEM